VTDASCYKNPGGLSGCVAIVVYPDERQPANRRGFTVWRSFSPPNSVSLKGETAMAKTENLGALVQRYGYAKKQKVKLYGKELELVSDPTDREGEEVVVEAREKGSEHVRQVQVPRNVVEMAKSSRSRRR
jgi:hypothetical protein